MSPTEVSLTDLLRLFERSPPPDPMDKLAWENLQPERKPNLLPVMGMWIGDTLPRSARLSMQSFLRAGHPYHFYTYRDYPDLPDAVKVMDANRILPEATIFKVSNSRGYSPFSDWFRYELLCKHKGWWADMDIICLRPLDIRGSLVVAAENNISLGSALVKCTSRRHPVVRTLRSFYREPESFYRFHGEDLEAYHQLREKAEQQEGAELQALHRALYKKHELNLYGPGSLTAVVRRWRERTVCAPRQAFYSVGWRRWRELCEEPVEKVNALIGNSYVVHLWAAMHRGSSDTESWSSQSFIGQIEQSLERAGLD